MIRSDLGGFGGQVICELGGAGREMQAGRLDHEAVNAVVSAAGHRVRRVRREWPARLSEREVEVLRLLAQARPELVCPLVLGTAAAVIPQAG